MNIFSLRTFVVCLSIAFLFFGYSLKDGVFFGLGLGIFLLSYPLTKYLFKLQTSALSLDYTLKDFFLASVGCCSIFFLLPFTQMIAQDTQVFWLGTWNWWIFSQFLFFSYIVIPLGFAVICVLIAKIHKESAYYFLALFSAAMFAASFRFFYYDEIPSNIYLLDRIAFHFDKQKEFFVLTAFVLLGFVLAWNLLKNFIFELLKVASVASVLMMGYFVSFAAPSTLVNYSDQVSVRAAANDKESKVNTKSSIENYPIFVLSFEKLVLSWFTDTDKKIIAESYPNLAKFVENADYYPNAYANSVHTIFALTSMYTGMNFRSMKTPTKNSTLKVSLAKDRSAYLLLDILNYCDPMNEHCFRTIGIDSIDSKQFLLGWYKTFSKTVLPISIKNELKLDDWHFQPWGEVWKNEQSLDSFVTKQNSVLERYSGLKPYQAEISRGYLSAVDIGERQFQFLHNLVVKNKDKPALYLMHNFITDSPYFVSDFKSKSETEQRILHSKRLQPFDQQLGVFFNLLKQLGLYEKSLIVVVSDTGYYPEIEKIEHNKEIDFHPDIANVVLAIKRPNQKFGRVIPSVTRQIDVLPTLLDIIGEDINRYSFDGKISSDPSFRFSFKDRPLNLQLSNGRFVVRDDSGKAYQANDD